MFKCRNYKKIYIITLTPIFLLGLSYYSVFSIQKPAVAAEIDAQGPQGIQSQDFNKSPRLEYNAYDLRDPFEDLLAQKKESERKAKEENETFEPLPSLTVQGVIWGGATPQAIINNKIVKIGDVTEEAEVIGIGKEGVTLLYKNHTYTLPSPTSSYMNTIK